MPLRPFTFVLILLLFGLAACQCDKISTKPSVEIILPDSSKKHELSIWYRYVRNIRRELNLKNLELGVDSFELRIYQDGALFTPDQLHIIKKEDGIWTCTVTSP